MGQHFYIYIYTHDVDEDVQYGGDVLDVGLGREEQTVRQDLERQFDAHADNEAVLGDLQRRRLHHAVPRGLEHHRDARQRRDEYHHPVEIRD